MKTITLFAVILAALSAASAVPAAASGQWIHVAVDESGPDGTTVRVNVPVELVSKVLPLIRHEGLAGGKIKVELGEEDMSAADLRAIWDAVRSSSDGDYVTVDGPKEKVRVTKRGGLLLVQAQESREKQERVEVEIPLAVVDALFSGTENDELNLAAAVEALARHGRGNLVTVNDADSHVRIWVDSADGEK
jgi:hypothetical protein